MDTFEIVGYRFAVRITYTVVQDIPANRSAVRITKVEIRSLWSGGGSCWLTGGIHVNGEKAASLILSNTQACAVALSGSYSGGGESWSGFLAQEVVLEHLADGSRAQVPFRVELTVISTASGNRLDPGISETVAVDLPQIPRVSELTAQPVTLGKMMTVRLCRASDSFRDSLIWLCGEESGVIAQRSGDTEFHFTPPVSLAAQAPQSTAAAVTVQVTTWQGETIVGIGEITVRCPIPEDLVPQAAMTLSDRMGYAALHGGYIQSQSQLRVVTQAAGTGGASIAEIRVSCGGMTAAGDDLVFSMPDSGSVPVAVTVKDSRGRETTVRQTVDVIPYNAPRAVIRQVYRCDEAGAAQADGLYAAVVFDGEVTAVENASALWSVSYRIRGGDEVAAVELPEYDDILSLAGGQVILPVGADDSYVFSVAVTDSFQTVSSEPVLVGVAFALLDMSRAGRAVGIGMRAKTAGMLSVGLHTDMDQHRITNLASPEAAMDAVTKEYVDSRLRLLAQSLGGEWNE